MESHCLYFEIMYFMDAHVSLSQFNLLNLSCFCDMYRQKIEDIHELSFLKYLSIE